MIIDVYEKQVMHVKII